MESEGREGTGGTTVWAPPPPERRERRFGLAVVIAAGAAGVIIGAAGAYILTGDGGDGETGRAAPGAAAEGVDVNLESTRFELAFAACGGAAQLERINVEDEGTSIIVDGVPDSGDVADSIDDTVCILNEIDVPSYVITQMESTTSLMGRQTASWDDIEASWSYHPDNGLDIVLVDTA
jgi:hypothetical protein